MSDPANQERAFLEKVSPVFNGVRFGIPAPRLSPAERLQRRLAFRNPIYVYTRKSLFSQANIMSVFSPETRFSVVSSEEWFSDAWSTLDFGQSLDFGRPVFEQLRALRDTVPHMARSALFNENCEYASNLSHCRNCYLIFNSTHVEDSMYGESLWRSKDCLDCSYLYDSELCYDCLMCERCYNLQCSWDCEGCSDSFYLLGCRFCAECFGCVNLRHKQYYIYNEPVTKGAYQSFLGSLDLSSRALRRELAAKAEALWRSKPRPHVNIQHAENAHGNYLYHSKDLEHCFFVREGESLCHCAFLYGGARDCRDFTFVGLNCELMYECAWCALDCRLCRFCFWCLQSSELLYCWHCIGCRHCFGCAGLRNKEYCIFNTQYTAQQYAENVPKIIDHMTRTGEWGEFFPTSMSPIPYNHSMAQRFFPLTRDEAHGRSYGWYDKPLMSASGALPAGGVPDRLPAGDDPLILTSQKSGAAFRITAAELKHCRLFQAPLPSEAYDERLNARALRLGGLQLHRHRCARTGRPVLTNFPSDCGWIIWDREVYEAEVN